MKLVFTDQNRLVVSNIANLLESEGIDFDLRNEFASGGAGGLAPTDVWLEIWVESERDAARAKAVIDDATRSLDPDRRWICNQCHETNESSFDFCWRCQHENE